MQNLYRRCEFICIIDSNWNDGIHKIWCLFLLLCLFSYRMKSLILFLIYVMRSSTELLRSNHELLNTRMMESWLTDNPTIISLFWSPFHFFSVYRWSQIQKAVHGNHLTKMPHWSIIQNRIDYHVSQMCMRMLHLKLWAL